MRTEEERIARLHERAREIQNVRIRRRLAVESALTGALGLCMLAAIVLSGGSGTAIDTGYAGASMLDVSVGGYILVAILAFLFGAGIAILIRTYREKKRMDLEEHSKKA